MTPVMAPLPTLQFEDDIMILLYCVAWLLYWLHLALIDCKMYDYQHTVPNWLKTDWVYLGGSLVTTLLLVIAIRCWNENAVLFWRYTVFNIFLGSIAWDWLYGWLVHQDPLFPYNDWFNDWGFNGSKTKRLIFDLFRLVIALAFLAI